GFWLVLVLPSPKFHDQATMRPSLSLLRSVKVTSSPEVTNENDAVGPTFAGRRLSRQFRRNWIGRRNMACSTWSVIFVIAKPSALKRTHDRSRGLNEEARCRRRR